MEELDDILSGPRSFEPVVMEPVLIPRTNLMACSSATHLPAQPALLKDLLRTGSSIHERDANGDTCLHAAIFMSHPEQPWVVQSLSALIQAGADPRQRNNAGYTAYDIACNGPFELGSFRKDLLLQAILESRSCINDDRLLAPRRLTHFYTSMQHDMICGKYSTQQTAIFRKALSDRLRNYVDYHRIPARSNVQHAAIDLVLSSDPAKWTANPDAVFHEVLDYLQRLLHGKARVAAMTRERLPPQICEGLQGHVDWPQMMDRALTASILEFDWFRPVDPEDVFLSHVDHLIEQLEDLDTGDEARDYIDYVIQVLQNSIPSYRAVSVSKSDSSASRRSTWSGPSTTSSSSNSPRTQRSSTLSLQTDTSSLVALNESDISRKESIAKTPAEYYPQGLRAKDGGISVKLLRPIDSNSSSDAASDCSKRQKWRWATKKRKA
jgi:hypothetical protein